LNEKSAATKVAALSDSGVLKLPRSLPLELCVLPEQRRAKQPSGTDWAKNMPGS
jgi:hypothetical protein